MKKPMKIETEYLAREIRNLTKLVEINGIINSTLDIGKLLKIIMEMIKDIMNTEASTLLLYDSDMNSLVFKVALSGVGKELTEKYRIKLGEGIAGWVAQTRKPLTVNDVYNDERFNPEYDKRTGFFTKAIICAPLLFKGKLIGVIQAINPLKKDGFDFEDISLFQVFSDQAALAVQNAIFFKKAINEERIDGELLAARLIQESLLPNVNKSCMNADIAAKSLSAREIGGEFHGILSLGNNTVAITLGDIHEKGIPGGLRVSMLSGAIKSLSDANGKNPLEMIKILKKTVIEEISKERDVSLFYGTFDSDKKVLEFVNAGVAYPILIRDGVARYIKYNSGNISKENEKLKKVVLKLRKDDKVIIFTEGILKVKNQFGVRLGLKKVLEYLSGNFTSAAQMLNLFMEYASGFQGGPERREDMSVVVIWIN